MTSDSDSIIRKHYQEQAQKDGDSPLCTMGEQVVREKEVDFIRHFLGMVQGKTTKPDLTVLDAGCGNGYTLEVLRGIFPSFHLHGLEFTEELLAIARNRNLRDCTLAHGDIRATQYQNASFDVVYTERCLINILDHELQKKAIHEIARILRPSGYYLMIECFNDGLANNNKARREMGLTDIAPAFHNLYFDPETLFREINDVFQVVDPAKLNPGAAAALQSNFLSSHFFVARILHPLLTKGDWVRNTEFVKFFSFLPPTGNYAPIKGYILKKMAGKTS